MHLPTLPAPVLGMALLVPACVVSPSPDGDDDDSATPTDGDDDSTPEPPDPEDLNGVWLETPIPLPTFEATNRDGTARGPVDLVGQPSVLWFYPAAFTGT